MIKNSRIRSHLPTCLVGRYNMLQVLASWRQFRIPSIVTFLVTWSDQRWLGPPFLRLPPSGSNSKTANWVGAIHTSDMIQPSKTLHFNTLHHVDVIVYSVQLLVQSYASCSSIAERSINLLQDFPLEDA